MFDINNKFSFLAVTLLLVCWPTRAMEHVNNSSDLKSINRADEMHRLMKENKLFVRSLDYYADIERDVKLLMKGNKNRSGTFIGYPQKLYKPIGIIFSCDDNNILRIFNKDAGTGFGEKNQLSDSLNPTVKCLNSLSDLIQMKSTEPDDGDGIKTYNEIEFKLLEPSMIKGLYFCNPKYVNGKYSNHNSKKISIATNLLETLVVMAIFHKHNCEFSLFEYVPKKNQFIPKELSKKDADRLIKQLIETSKAIGVSQSQIHREIGDFCAKLDIKYELYKDIISKSNNFLDYHQPHNKAPLSATDPRDSRHSQGLTLTQTSSDLFSQIYFSKSRIHSASTFPGDHLVQAIDDNDIAKIDALLRQHSVRELETNKPLDGNYICPLHFACALGHINIVKKLIEAGFDINFRSSNVGMRVPLSYAAETGQEDLQNYLIQSGANLNIKDNFDRRPLDWIPRSK